MKNVLYIITIFATSLAFAQEEEKTEKTGKSDTTRVKLGSSEIIVISKGQENKSYKIEELDTVDAAPPIKKRKSEAQWAGIDFGVSMNLDANGSDKFASNPYWKNDPAKSWYFHLNLMEKKFKIIKEYVGLTTGIGFHFNSMGIRNNYDIVDTPDSLYAEASALTYSKNKLNSAYFSVPLLLEFRTDHKHLNLSVGVVGGVRMGSKTTQHGEQDGKEFETKVKSNYDLNAFKIDGVVRLGIASMGVHVGYSLLPLFDVAQTVPVHPVNFGLTLNF
jgi:hypothetical protein